MQDMNGRVDAFLKGALGGGVLGIAFAAMATVIGVLRAAFHFFSTGSLPQLRPEDVSALMYYFGGFLVAGVVVGSVGVFLPGRQATYGRFALGGMVVMLAVLMGEGEGLTTIDSFDWGMVVVLGGLFGAAAARGWLHGG